MLSSNQNPSNRPFTPADLNRVLTETFIERVDFHEQIGSTNDRALEINHAAGEKFPLLVLADLQTAGRGRGANQWWAGNGALTFSVLLATEAATLPMERWPQVSLTVGLAVCEALEESLARGVPETSRDSLPAVQLKWPNDVYIEDRKICGILVEAPTNRQGRLLLGIGINVNNSLTDASEELQNTATSLLDLTGRAESRTDVLIQTLKQLADRLQPAGFWNEAIRTGWRQRCWLTGKSIQIDLGVRQAAGICRGIDEQGALLLEGNDEVEAHFAGVITVMDR